jgi:hypothetical protein
MMAAEDEVLNSQIQFWDLGGVQLVECELFGTLPVFGVEPGFEGGPFDFVPGAPGNSKGDLEVDVLIGRDGTDDNREILLVRQVVLPGHAMLAPRTGFADLQVSVEWNADGRKEWLEDAKEQFEAKAVELSMGDAVFKAEWYWYSIAKKIGGNSYRLFCSVPWLLTFLQTSYETKQVSRLCYSWQETMERLGFDPKHVLVSSRARGAKRKADGHVPEQVAFSSQTEYSISVFGIIFIALRYMVDGRRPLKWEQNEVGRAEKLLRTIVDVVCLEQCLGWSIVEANCDLLVENGMVDAETLASSQEDYSVWRNRRTMGLQCRLSFWCIVFIWILLVRGVN